MKTLNQKNSKPKFENNLERARSYAGKAIHAINSSGNACGYGAIIKDVNYIVSDGAYCHDGSNYIYANGKWAEFV